MFDDLIIYFNVFNFCGDLTITADTHVGQSSIYFPGTVKRVTLSNPINEYDVNGNLL